MNTWRLVLSGLAVIALLVAIAWFVIDLVRQPGTLPSSAILILGVAAALGVLARIAGYFDEFQAASRDAKAEQAAQETPFEADSGVFEVDLDETPDWLADVQPPPSQPEAPPPARPTIPAEGDPPSENHGSSIEITPEDILSDIELAEESPAEESGDVGESMDFDDADWSAEFDDDEGWDDDGGAADEDDLWQDEPAIGEENGGDRTWGGPPVAEESPPAMDWLAEEAEPEPETEAAGAVEFAAYYPPEVKPDDWQPLKAYIYKEDAYLVVVADAQAQFGPRDDIRETVAAALQPVPDDALVTAIPDVPGLEFDPPQASARFRKDWRRFDFEFRAVDAPLNESADGRITFFVEGVIVADVKLSVYVSRRAGHRVAAPQQAVAKPYQAVFCSYSHKDTLVVERVERSSRMHFTKFLRDVHTLRSGERWNDRLLELIDEADIFQLFWSKPASDSPYVKQEWQYALALRETGAKDRYFIRPVRWEEPMSAAPPAELADLHFDLIEELAGD